MAARKRGVGYITNKTTSLILGVMFILVIVAAGIVLFNTFFSDTGCENAAEWSVISSSLKSLESKSREEITIPFNAGDCHLVGFSKGQIFRIAPGSPVLENPQVCLCKIDENKCDPFKCYELTKFKEFSLPPEGDQFSTVDQRPQTFLTFTAKDDILEASILGVTKLNRAFNYSLVDDIVEGKPVAEKDPTFRVLSLDLAYDSRDDLQLVSVIDKGPSPFVPERSRMMLADGFPLFFDLKMDLVPEQGDARPLDSAKVVYADMVLLLPLEKVLALSDEQKNALSLFYREKDASWGRVPLTCEREKILDLPLGADTLADIALDLSLIEPCSAHLPAFSKSFALAPLAPQGGAA